VTNPVKPKKNKLRVEGVQYSKSMKTYAKNIEKTMLAMIADGYSVEMNEQSHGLLVIGRLMHEDEDEEGSHSHGEIPTLSGLLRSLGVRGAHIDRQELSNRSAELFNRFAPVWRESPDMTAFVKASRENIQSISKGFDTNELSTAVIEFEKEAMAHDQRCNNAKKCEFSAILRNLVEVIKDTAKTQLS
jgi:hypothetical protein